MGTGASISSSLREAGNEAFKKGDYEQAVYHYSLALRESVDDPILFSNRSASYFKLGQYAAAIMDAKNSIIRKPSWSKGYYRAGVAFKAMGFHVPAIDNLTIALSLSPVEEREGNGEVTKMLAELEVLIPHTARGRGYLMTWGEGYIGHPQKSEGSSVQSVTKPVVVDSLRGQSVFDVAAGFQHTVLVTTSGSVYSFGTNSTGACGLDNNKPVQYPQLVPTLLGTFIRAVACGSGHTLAIDIDGGVFSWGLNRQGQLGLSHLEDRLVPTKVPGMTGIKAAASGIAHNIVVDVEGKGYVFGWNNYGQCGVSLTTTAGEEGKDAAVSNIFISTPSSIDLDYHCNPSDSSQSTMTISHAACGGAHSLLVLADGTIWSCGSNSCGQLGHGDSKDRDYFHQIQQLADSHVSLASCGEEYSSAITRDHEVYSWGLNNVGQLGIGTMDNSTVPTVVKLRGEDSQPVNISCSQGQTFCVDGKGRIFHWGVDRSRLVDGVNMSPVQLAEVMGANVKALVCGRKHYCILTKAMDPRRCYLTRTISSTVIAGAKIDVKIQAVDVDNKALHSAGDKFYSYIYGDGGPLREVEVTDDLDGTYSFAFTMTSTGSYFISIVSAGVEIKDSPVPFTVVPGPCSPPFCTIEWSHHLSLFSTGDRWAGPTLTAGDICYCKVLLKDKFGNSTSDGGGDDVTVSMSIEGPGKGVSQVERNSSDPSRFDVTFSLTRAGTYSIAFFVGNDAIGDGKPFAVTVKPSQVYGPRCVARGVGLGTIVAGDLSTFTVELRDQMNNLTNEGNQMSAIMMAIGHLGVRSKAPYPCQFYFVQEEKSPLGIYKGMYEVTQAGDYQVSIKNGNDEISGSPFQVNVIPSEADPFSFVMTSFSPFVTCLKANISTYKHRIALEAFDEFHNKRHKGGDLISVTIYDSLKSVPLDGATSITDNTDGSYVIEYGTGYFGSFSVSLAVNGVQLVGSPYSLLIERDQADIDLEEKMALESRLRAEFESRLKESAAAKATADEAERQRRDEARRLMIMQQEERERVLMESAARREREAAEAQADLVEERRLKEEQDRIRREVEKQRGEETTRRRAVEAARKVKIEREEEERRKRAQSSKRTGGGWIIQYHEPTT